MNQTKGTVLRGKKNLKLVRGLCVLVLCTAGLIPEGVWGVTAFVSETPTSSVAETIKKFEEKDIIQPVGVEQDHVMPGDAGYTAPSKTVKQQAQDATQKGTQAAATATLAVASHPATGTAVNAGLKAEKQTKDALRGVSNKSKAQMKRARVQASFKNPLKFKEPFSLQASESALQGEEYTVVLKRFQEISKLSMGDLKNKEKKLGAYLKKHDQLQAIFDDAQWFFTKCPEKYMALIKQKTNKDVKATAKHILDNAFKMYEMAHTSHAGKKKQLQRVGMGAVTGLAAVTLAAMRGEEGADDTTVLGTVIDNQMTQHNIAEGLEESNVAKDVSQIAQNTDPANNPTTTTPPVVVTPAPPSNSSVNPPSVAGG